MIMPYEKLPLIDLTAPRTISQRSKSDEVTPKESIAQDAEDAEAVLKLTGLYSNQHFKNILDAREKYMIEIQPLDKETSSSANKHVGMRQKGVRRPHYTRLLVFDDGLAFQAACCLPLKIIAAGLDGAPVSGRILYDYYSEEDGGKLVYEFLGKGTEMIIDLKRGESAKAQRLIFKGIE